MNTFFFQYIFKGRQDVPSAKIAVIISGTSSNREYVQRLGRILRKTDTEKLAILYEIIAQDTSEERVSQKRKQQLKPVKPVQKNIKYPSQSRSNSPNLKAAEKKKNWKSESKNQDDK